MIIDNKCGIDIESIGSLIKGNIISGSERGINIATDGGYFCTFMLNNITNNQAAENAVLISLIPLLSFTSHNAFGFTELVVFILLTKFTLLKNWEKTVTIMGFILIGGNIHDLWGHQISKFINDISLVSIGTLILLTILFIKRKQEVL